MKMNDVRTEMFSEVGTERVLGQLDIGTLFHCLLFAYQKSMKDILGTGSLAFVHPVLNIITRINEKRGVNLIKGENIDEVFDNLSELLQGTGMAKAFRFKKIAPETYVFHVDGCIWASHIHEELKPQDVTCPFALLAMSIFQEVLKSQVKVADSEYLIDGAETRIELR